MLFAIGVGLFVFGALILVIFGLFLFVQAQISYRLEDIGTLFGYSWILVLVTVPIILTGGLLMGISWLIQHLS